MLLEKMGSAVDDAAENRHRLRVRHRCHGRRRFGEPLVFITAHVWSWQSRAALIEVRRLGMAARGEFVGASICSDDGTQASACFARSSVTFACCRPPR